jgi:hypothetical protein
VPAQKWADVTDNDGAFGAAILNDSKYGWDKPVDNVLRLTLIHTAKARAYPYQSSNDLGHHHFTYSVAGHVGDWRTGKVPARAAELNQPLVAFQTEAHAGRLGRSVSILSLDDSNNQVAVRALKKAEDSDEIVVRVQELYGRRWRRGSDLRGRSEAFARSMRLRNQWVRYPFRETASRLSSKLINRGPSLCVFKLQRVSCECRMHPCHWIYLSILTVSQPTLIEPTETSTEKGKRSLVNCFLKNTA